MYRSTLSCISHVSYSTNLKHKIITRSHSFSILQLNYCPICLLDELRRELKDRRLYPSSLNLTAFTKTFFAVSRYSVCLIAGGVRGLSCETLQRPASILGYLHVLQERTTNIKSCRQHDSQRRPRTRTNAAQGDELI